MTSTFASRCGLLLLLSCRTPLPEDSGSTGGDGGALDGGGDGGAPPEPVLLQDGNNYAFSGILDGPSFPLAEYSDVSLSWASLTEDLQCHPLDPVEDIDNVALMIFPRLSEEEVELGLANDSLEQVDLGVYLSYEPFGDTEVSLTELTFFGTDADIEAEFYEGHGAWLLVLTTGTTIGVGSRMIAFMTPTAEEPAMTGEIRDGCEVLDAHADLEALEAVPVSSTGPWTLDWSALRVNAIGQPFQPLDVSEVMLARYPYSREELQARFLDLELIADRTWTAPHLSGTQVDLSTLVDEADGSSFSGFTAGSGSAEAETWLFALRCGTCANPAPPFLTVVLPEE